MALATAELSGACVAPAGGGSWRRAAARGRIVGFRETPSRRLRCDLDAAASDIAAALAACRAETLGDGVRGRAPGSRAANALAASVASAVPVWEFAAYNYAGGRVRSNGFADDRGGEIRAARPRRIGSKAGASCLYASERRNLRHVEADRKPANAAGHDYAGSRTPDVLFRERFRGSVPPSRVDFDPSPVRHIRCLDFSPPVSPCRGARRGPRRRAQQYAGSCCRRSTGSVGLADAASAPPPGWRPARPRAWSDRGRARGCARSPARESGAPSPSNSSRRPGQRSSTPLTAVPGPTTKPFHTLLATACGSRRGVPSSPEASRARSSEAKAIDQPAFGIGRPCQVERLDAERIPGQREPALLGVPAGEREHAAQPAHRFRPMQAERAKHHGRVAGGLYLLPLGHEAPPQVAEIVDLAVEDDHVPGHRVHHRLGAGGREVEDREPAMGKQRAPAASVRRRRPTSRWQSGPRWIIAPFIRSSAARLRFVQPPDDPGDATHQSVPQNADPAGCGLRSKRLRSSGCPPAPALRRDRFQVCSCTAGSRPRRRATISRPASQMNSLLVVR